MRAVIDTSILIRALIKPEGTVGPVLRSLAAGAYTIIYSEPLLKELLAKLALPRIRDKYRIDEEAVEILLEVFALRGELVLPDRTVPVCRDPNDDMLIEAALAG
jgi:putative PIN family toxin of toxin-antitoxin system